MSTDAATPAAEPTAQPAAQLKGSGNGGCGGIARLESQFDTRRPRVGADEAVLHEAPPLLLPMRQLGVREGARDIDQRLR